MAQQLPPLMLPAALVRLPRQANRTSPMMSLALLSLRGGGSTGCSFREGRAMLGRVVDPLVPVIQAGFALFFKVRSIAAIHPLCCSPQAPAGLAFSVLFRPRVNLANGP